MYLVYVNIFRFPFIKCSRTKFNFERYMNVFHEKKKNIIKTLHYNALLQ